MCIHILNKLKAENEKHNKRQHSILSSAIAELNLTQHKSTEISSANSTQLGIRFNLGVTLAALAVV